jgi:hypothetical protein
MLSIADMLKNYERKDTHPDLLTADTRLEGRTTKEKLAKLFKTRTLVVVILN